MGPEQAVLVADQPRAERHPGLLLRQQVPRPPAGRADRLHRGGRQLRDRQRTGQGKGRRRRRHARPTTAPTPTTACPTATTSTTPTWTRRPTARRRRCRCTCSTSPARRTPTATRSRRPTAATRPTPSTTSTPTACPTGSSSTPTGNSTLGTVQAGAMGEAWSDWYAMDYLVSQGLAGRQAAARPTSSTVPVRRRGRRPRSAPSRSTARSASTSAAVHRRRDRPRGGYTYGDYGNDRRRPRGARRRRDLGADPVGPARRGSAPASTESLVTRAMELAPPTRRSSTCATRSCMADTARQRRRRTTTRSGRCSPHRGMGFFAGSPRRRRHRPRRGLQHPAGQRTTRARITGTVTDAATGEPVAGVPVTLAFQGAPGAANPTDDHRRRRHVLASARCRSGTLPEADRVTAPATTRPAARSRSTRPVRPRTSPCAATGRPSSGGATIADFNGPDFGPGCGPAQAIDISQATGWGITTGNDDGDPTNVFVPEARHVDLTRRSTSPTSRSTRGDLRRRRQRLDRRLPDRDLARRHDLDRRPPAGTFTSDDRGRLNTVTPTAGAAGVSSSGSRSWATRRRTSPPTAPTARSPAAPSPT